MLVSPHIIHHHTSLSSMYLQRPPPGTEDKHEQTRLVFKGVSHFWLTDLVLRYTRAFSSSCARQMQANTRPTTSFS